MQYICNRFTGLGQPVLYVVANILMCGVRCTPNLVAYYSNGLHLTFRGEGVIFKLLHKLILTCLITYFSVLYHGERFQIKGTFSKVHRQQKLSL